MVDDLYHSPEALKQAWAAADAEGLAQPTPAERVPAMVHSCYCALVCSSLVSRASPFSMTLLDRLVYEEVWNPSEALAAAQGRLTAEMRNAMDQYLDSKADRIDPDELAMLLEPSQALDDFYFQLVLLIDLAASMSEIDQSLWIQTIFDRAYDDHRPWYYARVIEGLRHHQLDVSERVVQQVFDRITALEPTVDLIFALGRMAQDLAPDRRSSIVDQVLALTRRIADPAERLWALHHLLYLNLGDLQDVIYREALAEVQALPTRTERVAACIMLADKLTEADLRSALRDAEKPGNATDLLPLLRRLLALGYSSETMGWVQTHVQPDAQLGTLMRLADELAASELGAVLEMINALRSVEARSSELRGVLRYLPEPLLSGVLHRMRLQGDNYARFDILSSMTEDPLPESVGQELLALLQERQAEQLASYMLYRAAKQLPDMFVGQMLTLSRQVHEPQSRLPILVVLAPRLETRELPSVLREVLTLVPRTRYDPYLPDPIEAVVRLLPSLTHAMQRTILAQARDAVQSIPDPYWRVLASVALMPRLGPTDKRVVQAEALALAQDLQGVYQRARSLVEIAATLPEQEQISVLEQAFAAAILVGDQWQMGYDEWAMKAWVVQAVSLSDEALYRLWSTVLHYLGEGLRRNMLDKLKLCVPIIDRLGGSSALTGIADAVLSVGVAVP
jgi:hypothetical protein